MQPQERTELCARTADTHTHPPHRCCSLPQELKELCAILNPDKVEGRLVLITRYGAEKVAALLPAHIKAVQESGVPVVWQCDGVHGNTVER